MSPLSTDPGTWLVRLPTLPKGRYTLTVEGEGGDSVTLDGAHPAAVLVGTSPVCDLCLTDRRASRRHLALELVGERLRVTDLDSTNGTRVDHVSVQQAWLRGGERLYVGDTVLLVSRDEDGVNPEVPFASGFGRVLGESREMRRLYPLCEKLAQSRVPVVIEGETGTGKEVLAEALHEQGPGADGPFVVFDCTAVAPNLVEAELFGHEKGAFTGAVGTRRGVFEQAHGGTLLIDEIGDLDLALQPKLLRAIEKREIKRVGSERAIAVDVRILAATRRDLDREVQAGRFRDDLFHRLVVARVALPALRERQGDISLLARHFFRDQAATSQPSAALLAKWEAWHWPGNVRELRNAVLRAIALGEDAEPFSLPVSDAPGDDLLERLLAAGLPYSETRRALLEELERRYTERLLAAHGGNVSRAARASGLARRHFQRIRARLGEER